MTRRVLLAAVIAVLAASPLRADLKYTMKIAAHQSTAPATAPSNPILGMLAPMLISMIAPPGGLELTVLVGERGTRVEYSNAFLDVPAGGAVLVAPDGSTIVLNPAGKTYWKGARPDAGAVGSIQPDVKVTQTGEFATIAGTRAERSTIAIRVALPFAGGNQLPGLPADLSMSGDIWLAEQYARYAQLAPSLSSALGGVKVDKGSAKGLLLRSILRSELFGTQEIEASVTSLSEGDVPASAFQVPEGYTEVPAPTGLPVIGR